MQVPLIPTSECLPERPGEPDCPVSKLQNAFILHVCLVKSANVFFTQLYPGCVSVLPEDSEMQVRC